VRFGAIDRTTGENVGQATGVSLGMLKDETIQGSGTLTGRMSFSCQ
jgi:hypothetical protein